MERGCEGRIASTCSLIHGKFRVRVSVRRHTRGPGPELADIGPERPDVIAARRLADQVPLHGLCEGAPISQRHLPVHLCDAL